jgi:DNA repair protein RecO
MAHQYSTDALVLGSYNAGEANKTYILFTELFGLLYCQARSVRKEGAKLSSNLQPLSRSTVTLIRGKKGWKVVGSVETGNIYYALQHAPQTRDMVIRIAKLVRRLVRGEEKNHSLFQALMQGLSYCLERELDAAAVASVERLLALRILATLGYMTPQPQFTSLLAHYTVEEGDVALLADQKAIATREINAALKNAQL